jgi:hypothetical protein
MPLAPKIKCMWKELGAEKHGGIDWPEELWRPQKQKSKIRLPLSAAWMYKWGWIKSHSFLITALEEGEQSASSPDRLASRKYILVHIEYLGLIGPSARADTSGTRKISCHCQNRTANSTFYGPRSAHVVYFRHFQKSSNSDYRLLHVCLFIFLSTWNNLVPNG